MTLRCECRECKARLQQSEQALGLCADHHLLAADYHLYDALREQGYMPFQAKLMAGLADPPDPDDD